MTRTRNHALLLLLGALVLGSGCVQLDPISEPVICEYMGQTYTSGEVFPADDGCNTCICNAEETLWPGQVLCTARGCGAVDAGGPAPITCVYMGRIYQDKQIFPAGDGCNTCMCNPEEASWPGQVLCTAIGCNAQDAGFYPDAARYPDAGFYPDAALYPNPYIDASPPDALGPSSTR